MERLKGFINYLHEKGKSANTIKGYALDVQQYIKWFEESYEKESEELYRQNILEYISFLKTVKVQNARTINHKLSSLSKYNAASPSQ
ncbi:MAG: site-specific integrase [Eubacteriales bacterium]